MLLETTYSERKVGSAIQRLMLQRQLSRTCCMWEVPLWIQRKFILKEFHLIIKSFDFMQISELDPFAFSIPGWCHPQEGTCLLLGIGKPVFVLWQVCWMVMVIQTKHGNFETGRSDAEGGEGWPLLKM